MRSLQWPAVGRPYRRGLTAMRSLPGEFASLHCVHADPHPGRLMNLATSRARSYPST